MSILIKPLMECSLKDLVVAWNEERLKALNFTQ